MEAIAARSKIGIDLERAPEFRLDLRDAQTSWSEPDEFQSR